MHFDLLIQHGDLIDPATHRRGRFDIGVRRGRIAAVAPHLPAESAVRVVDASGLLVTPGLVDLHTHLYYGVTYWGIDPNPLAARGGVTTWVDAGSAGAYNLIGLHEFVGRRLDVRMYAFLNISAIGLTAPTGEHLNLEYCDTDLCCRMAERFPGFVVGIKARIDRNTTGQHGLEPLRRARLAAERCDLPLMVHIGIGPPELDDLLPWLRPGDILTHCCTGHNMRLVDDTGALRESARRARELGVIFDVGHGGGSFSFTSAEALAAAEIWPDAISSDMHQLSVHGPMYDLPTCMSKLLMLGMPLEQVIRAATSRPAEVLGLEAGALRVGAPADIALLLLESGEFPLYDVHLQRRDATVRLRCVRTFIGGRELPVAPLPEPMPWITPAL